MLHKRTRDPERFCQHTAGFSVKLIYDAAHFHSPEVRSLQKSFFSFFLGPLMPLVTETRLQSKPVRVIYAFSVRRSASSSGCSPPESLAPERSWTRTTGIWTDLSLLQSEWTAFSSPPLRPSLFIGRTQTATAEERCSTLLFALCTTQLWFYQLLSACRQPKSF